MILSRLSDAGFEAYIVGGCVRDSLLGKFPSDWDITTNAKPEEIKKTFEGCNLVEIGIVHGTIGVITDDIITEITTYRIDGEYLDSRHPETVSFTTSLREDLKRRDFTINAMAYNLKDGLIDYFNGCNDLKNEIIRTVGDPKKRFSEDALRILRALRFSSTLGFNIEESSETQLRVMSHMLENISAERKYIELTKLLFGSSCENVLSKHNDIISKVIPELEPTYLFDQNHPYHHLPLWEHLCKTVANVENDPALKYAALLHDIAKPLCANTQNGLTLYDKHETLGAVIAESVMTRLKAPTKLISEVYKLVKLHEYNIEPYPSRLKLLLKETGSELAIKLMKLRRADIMAQEPAYIHRTELIDHAEEEIKRIIISGECYNRSILKIDGNDAKAAGYLGADIGKVLEKILLEVIDGATPNNRPRLLSRLQEMRN